MRFEFVEQIEGLVENEATLQGASPAVLIITKQGKFLRGHIVDHNVRINSEGRVRGRIVFWANGQKKDIDANDITSLESLKSRKHSAAA